MFKKLFSTGLAAFAALASAQIPSIRAYALTDENDLVRFSFGTDGTLTTDFGGAILGLQGQDLVGIDYRPSDKRLYALGNFGDIFRIDTNTRRATLVSTVGVQLQGSRSGIDFDPVTDRLRIVSEVRQNLSVNVDTGQAIAQGALSAPPNGSNRAPEVTGIAYANPVPGTGSPTLYALGSGPGGDLFRINDPSSGAMTRLDALGDFSTSRMSGFDIVGNYGYALTRILNSNALGGGGFSLNVFDLTPGQTPDWVRSVPFGGGDTFDGLAIAPVPEPATMAAMAVGLGFLARRRRR